MNDKQIALIRKFMNDPAVDGSSTLAEKNLEIDYYTLEGIMNVVEKICKMPIIVEFVISYKKCGITLYRMPISTIAGECHVERNSVPFIVDVEGENNVDAIRTAIIEFLEYCYDKEII